MQEVRAMILMMTLVIVVIKVVLFIPQTLVAIFLRWPKSTLVLGVAASLAYVSNRTSEHVRARFLGGDSPEVPMMGLVSGIKADPLHVSMAPVDVAPAVLIPFAVVMLGVYLLSLLAHNHDDLAVADQWGPGQHPSDTVPATCHCACAGLPTTLRVHATDETYPQT